jgi:predicted methyltransferase
MTKISSKTAMEILDCMDIKNCRDEDLKLQISMIENSAKILYQTANNNDFARIKKKSGRLLKYTKEARGLNRGQTRG